MLQRNSPAFGGVETGDFCIMIMNQSLFFFSFSGNL